MPRIRTLKPAFWQDEKLAPMAPLTRLVFIGLISMADDAGRLIDNVKTIDGFLFPHTEDSSRNALEALAKEGRILRYPGPSGQRLIQITGWTKHQKIDKPSQYVLPAPSDLGNSRESLESLANASRDPRDPLAKVQGSDLRSRNSDHGARRGNASPAPAPDWAAAATDLWRFKVGSLDSTELLQALESVVDRFGWSVVSVDLEQWIEESTALGKPCRPQYYAERAAQRLSPSWGAERRQFHSAGDSAKSAEIVARLRELVQEHLVPGHGTRRILKLSDVEEMGPEVAAALRICGGVQRVVRLDEDLTDLPFFIREFGNALTTQSQPVPAPGT